MGNIKKHFFKTGFYYSLCELKSAEDKNKFWKKEKNFT